MQLGKCNFHSFKKKIVKLNIRQIINFKTPFFDQNEKKKNKKFYEELRKS